jgi:hypothetical protein
MNANGNTTNPGPDRAPLGMRREYQAIPVTVAAGDIPKILENKSSQCGKMEMILQLRG